MSTSGAGVVLVGLAVTLLLGWVAPPVLLRLVVRAYPPGHPRRGELLRELDDVGPCERLRWVASLAIPCAREGAAARRADQSGEPRSWRALRDRSVIVRLVLAASLSFLLLVVGGRMVAGIPFFGASDFVVGSVAFVVGGVFLAASGFIFGFQMGRRRRLDARDDKVTGGQEKPGPNITSGAGSGVEPG